MPQKPLKHTKLEFTVDNTPVGMQTPEGCGRVNAAMEINDKARTDAFRQLLRVYNALKDAEPSMTIAEFHKEYWDEIKYAAAGVTRWQDAFHGFTMAVAAIPTKP